MDWAETLKLKSGVKKGRRAGQNAAAATPSSSSIPSDYDKSPEDLSDSLKIDSGDSTMPRFKKSGGWADEVQKPSKNKPNINLIEQERFNSLSNTTTALSDDDIPVIPDLDDFQDEILSLDVGHAPSVSINRVAAYKELNMDLLKQGAFASLEDVDLSILAKCLQNESDLNEPDELWTWDKVFTDVTAKINSDKRRNSEDIISQFII